MSTPTSIDKRRLNPPLCGRITRWCGIDNDGQDNRQAVQSGLQKMQSRLQKMRGIHQRVYGTGLILLLFFSLALAPLTTTQAQVGEQRYNLAIGFGGGMTMNTVSFSPSIRQKSLKGMMGGVAVRYISEKYFNMICGAQLELNYAQHGWDESYEDYPDLAYTRKMNYIEVPLLAHLAFGRERGVQIFVHAGPQIGFFLGDSYTISSVSDWRDSGLTTDQHDKAVQNKFDYGITAGLGLELRTKAGHFQLEGRYYYALSDFYGNTKSDYFSRSAHGVITVRLGYMFDLTK